MPVEMKKFARRDKKSTAAFKKADAIAENLFAFLNSKDVQKRILSANSPGSSSALIQACFIEHALDVGFKNEAKDLFSSYQTSGLRPDYYKPIGNTGILLEVERGKTTINNMDLLDFWKCHLCEHANFLFLLVPTELRQNPRMSPRREFATVSKRMASFFEPRNYTNVHGLWLFGY